MPQSYGQKPDPIRPDAREIAGSPAIRRTYGHFLFLSFFAKNSIVFSFHKVSGKIASNVLLRCATKMKIKKGYGLNKVDDYPFIIKTRSRPWIREEQQPYSVLSVILISVWADASFWTPSLMQAGRIFVLNWFGFPEDSQNDATNCNYETLINLGCIWFLSQLIISISNPTAVS